MPLKIDYRDNLVDINFPTPAFSRKIIEFDNESIIPSSKDKEL